MGKLNRANIKKTLYYLKRNGMLNTYYAALERLKDKNNHYSYQELSSAQLAKQRIKQWKDGKVFSIVVPTYRTSEMYLRDMVDSVLKQTYPFLELILADATEDDSVEKIVNTYQDDRIRYKRLGQNDGISENTNLGLELATGDYVGLLDHDDVLTTDALYEMALCIEKREKDGIPSLLLYSDEDKCNEDRTRYYEPHFKEDFNLDLLLSNNYMCHLTVIKNEMIQKIRFRKEYNGAQDFDLVLRTVAEIKDEKSIVHIPKVLYHWRCHSGSTAENPQSKKYAYEAGRRAVQDFANQRGWNAVAIEQKHVGFYELQYKPDILAVRTDIGAVGGRILKGNKVSGVIIGKNIQNNTCSDKNICYLYQGIHSRFSGYMHKAVLLQEVAAVDIRMIKLRQECHTIFEQVVGVPYIEVEGAGYFDYKTLPSGTDFHQISIALGNAIKKEGYRVVWNPKWSRKE